MASKTIGATFRKDRSRHPKPFFCAQKQGLPGSRIERIRPSEGQNGRGVTMGIVRFYAFVIQVAIALTLCGQLKSCTLIMLNKAGEKTEAGIMSYSKLSRLLTQ